MSRRRVLVLVVVLVLAAGCAGSEPKPVAGLQAQTTTVGGLDVTTTPTRIDADGATFSIVFDTHTGAPGIDVAASTNLTVDGVAWADPRWSGDGAGGHHRSGTLGFDAAGPARGTVVLVIDGLDRPLDMTWQLPDDG